MHGAAEVKTIPYCLISILISDCVSRIGLVQIALSFFSPLRCREERRAVNTSDATSPSSFSCSSAGHEVCVCVCACEAQINRRGVRCLVTVSFVHTVIKTLLYTWALLPLTSLWRSFPFTVIMFLYFLMYYTSAEFVAHSAWIQTFIETKTTGSNNKASGHLRCTLD